MESVRSCLVCRKKALKGELFRFVRAVDGEICFDEKGDLPHRGAWLCAKKACLSKALEKRMLFRGEKNLPVNSAVMMEHIASRIKKSTLARLGLMRRQGAVEMGMDAVKRAMGERVDVVVLAKDFSVRSKNEIGQAVLKQGLQIVESPFLMDEIGICLGRKKTGVVGLLQGRITNEVLFQLSRLSEIEAFE